MMLLCIFSGCLCILFLMYYSHFTEETDEAWTVLSNLPQITVGGGRIQAGEPQTQAPSTASEPLRRFSRASASTTCHRRGILTPPQALGLPGNQTLTQRFACSRLTGQNAQSELLSDREGSRLGRGRRRAVI